MAGDGWRWVMGGLGAVLVSLFWGVGSMEKVDVWRWVEPLDVNGRRVVEAPGLLKSCGIVPGGKVTELGRDGGDVLVRYDPPSPPIGTQCEAGAVFFLDAEVYDGMTERFEAIKAARETKAEKAARILRGGG